MVYDLKKMIDGGHPHFADGGYSRTPPDSDEPAAQVSPVRVYIDGKEVMGVHMVQVPSQDNDN